MAALLTITAWNMAEPEKWKADVTGPRQDGFLILLTMVLTVVVDLTFAIGLGVTLGLALRRQGRGRPARDWHPREKMGGAGPWCTRERVLDPGQNPPTSQASQRAMTGTGPCPVPRAAAPPPRR